MPRTLRFAPCGVVLAVASLLLHAASDPLPQDKGAAGDFRRLLSRVDVLCVNEAESKLYAPAPAEARTTVIKLGARGSRWISDGTDTRVAAPRVRAVDTTGAGDAFNGGFLTAYLGGGSPRDCLRFGNEIGARSTLAPGGIAGLPTRSTRPARPARP